MAGDHRREEPHDPLDAKGCDTTREHQIDQTGNDDATAGVRQAAGIKAGFAGHTAADHTEAAQKCERRTEECGYLASGNEMKQQRTCSR